jgi:hypothetical protein
LSTRQPGLALQRNPLVWRPASGKLARWKFEAVAAEAPRAISGRRPIMVRPIGRLRWLVTAGVLSLVACKPPPPPPPPPQTGERPPAAIAREAEREKEALDAAVQAYVYGYPLVSAELARRVDTNVEKAAGGQAPMGQLARAPAQPPTPWGPVDTLAVAAWLDVGAEPWVLSLPDARGRFHTVVIRSAWSDLLDTAGGKGAKGRPVRLAVTGPGWSGKLPPGVRQVKSPTALVQVEGRVLAVGGAGDRAEAQAWLDRITLLPLGANPKKYLPPPGRPDASLEVRTPIREQVHAIDAVVYFKLMAALLKSNPPAAADATLLPTLARIGLVPGKDYDPSGLDASVIKALAGVPKAAQEKIMLAAAPAAPVHGWTVAGAGASSPGYLGRAAQVAAGADRVLDGVVLTAEVDGSGKPLDGRVRRALRFTRGKGPPAEALWSITVYDERGAPVAGKLGRNQLTSRSKFQFGRDGSLELLLQVDWPKGRESNWLQVPAGPYALVLRLHGPREKPPSALDGSWQPPAVVKPK